MSQLKTVNLISALLCRRSKSKSRPSVTTRRTEWLRRPAISTYLRILNLDRAIVAEFVAASIAIDHDGIHCIPIVRHFARLGQRVHALPFVAYRFT
jgi:hypothetical protein